MLRIVDWSCNFKSLVSDVKVKVGEMLDHNYALPILHIGRVQPITLTINIEVILIHIGPRTGCL